MSQPQVSVVLTSCLRFDLLEKTLDSFFKSNTFPLAQFIIIEDSPAKDELKKVTQKYPFEFTLLSNSSRLGQLASIDRAYSHVKAPYIFHCEDDWLFTRHHFIEDSLKILENNPQIFSVWLREKKEYPHDIFEKNKVKTPEGTFYQTTRECVSFNPGLRRTDDYKKIESYCLNQNSDNKEIKLSEFYENLGQYSILLEPEAVKHIGWHRRVEDNKLTTPILVTRLQQQIKKVKSAFYKAFGKGHFKQN